MHFRVLVFLFCCLLITSCEQENEHEGSAKNHPVENAGQPDHAVRSQQVIHENDLTGVYRGTFPCSNCQQTDFIILLKPDKTYRQEEISVSTNKVQNSSSGLWRVQDGTLVLTKDLIEEMVFRQENDTLFAVSVRGVPLKDSASYALSRQQLASENEHWQSVRKKGIDFVGLGTEPFWNLEIKNGQASLRFMEKKPLIARLERSENQQDTLFYHSVGNSGKPWEVVVIPSFCSDGMSDFLYEYRVMVKYAGQRYTGCGILLDKD